MTSNQANNAAVGTNDRYSTDTDSAFNDSVGSDSYRTSLISSMKNYKYENGRRYHAFHEGSYVLPNDEEEQDRLDLGHHIYLMLLEGKLFLAPLSTNPQRVLDIGTGTGIWAIDFADQYPSAQVIGTDLSPIQPPWVPPNCIFEIDNFELDWVYSRGFDFIHARELLGSVADFDRLFTQAFKNLNTGGYFEFQTTESQAYSDDGTSEKAKNIKVFLKGLHEASEKFGKKMSGLDTLKQRMIEAGFLDITSTVLKLPIGPWPKDHKLKEIGKYQQVQQIEATAPYALALFTRVLQWEKEEVEVLCTGVCEELKDPSIHIYLKVHVIYGRKP